MNNTVLTQNRGQRFDVQLYEMRQLCKEGKLEELKAHFEKGISDEAIQSSKGVREYYHSILTFIYFCI